MAGDSSIEIFVNSITSDIKETQERIRANMPGVYTFEARKTAFMVQVKLEEAMELLAIIRDVEVKYL